jgi:hypothetical protein
MLTHHAAPITGGFDRTRARRHDCRVRLLVVLLVLAGCEEGEPPPPSPEVFIALTRDFEDFRSWTRLPVEAEAVPVGHPEGPSFIYVNRMPPAGERRFPVGTMMVKTVETGDVEDWAIHAMAKRGDGYGWENGTVGWEFFELAFDDEDEPLIVWRGPGPPSGLGYRVAGLDGGTAELVCANCHAPAWTNDSVLNDYVRLAY